MGGGARHFMPANAGGERPDARRLREEFVAAGYSLVTDAPGVSSASAGAPPRRLLGLFHQAHLPVAFDKVGAGRYSDELARPANAAVREHADARGSGEARAAFPGRTLTVRLLPDGRGRVDRQARARRRRRADDLGRDRVRSRGPGGARLRGADQRRPRSGQRHAGDRHRRSRDRRTRHHRRRQRALRAGDARPRGARLRGGVPLQAGSGARAGSELRPGRARFPDRSRSLAQAAARMGGRARSLRELDLQPPPARCRGPERGHQCRQSRSRRHRRELGQQIGRRQTDPRVPGPGRDRERRDPVSRARPTVPPTPRPSRT